MSLEFVYIAQLCECFELSISDIENLIDSVPAHDQQNVSDFCRMDPPSPGEKQPKLKPYEVIESEEARNRRGIGSSEAKLIAAAISKRMSRIVNLFNAHDIVLCKTPPGSDPDDNDEIRQHEIKHIADNYDLELTVYRRLLDVLCLNKNEAERHIKSTPYLLKPGPPADIVSSGTVSQKTEVTVSRLASSGKKEVSQKEAAKRLKVSIRTIRNWETGKTPCPSGYPGRNSLTPFLMFSEEFKINNRLKRDATAKNNARSASELGVDIHEFSEDADIW